MSFSPRFSLYFFKAKINQVNNYLFYGNGHCKKNNINEEKIQVNSITMHDISRLVPKGLIASPFSTHVALTGGKCGFNLEGPHAKRAGSSARISPMATVTAGAPS